MSTKDKALNIRIPADLHNAFRQAAEARGLPMSLLMRELITQYCQNHAQMDLLATPKKAKK